MNVIYFHQYKKRFVKNYKKQTESGGFKNG